MSCATLRKPSGGRKHPPLESLHINLLTATR
ncbi:hypothetical protein BOS5A_230897 [Bosea sp. EC-HK365B]|nr:hypothetical protein BOSE7B_50522 [Bosea sp. 7B]CAD5299171.1 hypothetical protein BOSE21B_90974 [Bosea sp. 21B]VVT61620.1 hypothetical protein BOS5A_230897 [Bosea sp. EC-HK365B]VXB07955.1 hypothetical protein BOSE127_100192 [Bosea sp. 127]